MDCVGPFTVHTVLCGECGGWVTPKIVPVVPHESQLECQICGTLLATFRTVEDVVPMSSV